MICTRRERVQKEEICESRISLIIINYKKKINYEISINFAVGNTTTVAQHKRYYILQILITIK